MKDLSGVKVGDKLLVEKSGAGYSEYVVIVTNITPTGIVVTKGSGNGEYRFNPDGKLRGSDSWSVTYARPFTADDAARFALQRKRTQTRKLFEQHSAGLTDAQCDAIQAILLQESAK